MDKIKVLFICFHNSARSQMAEALLKKYGGERFEVESAGLEPGKLNPLAIEVMKEDGIDISRNKTKSAFDFYKQGKKYNYVFTVCNEADEGKCPVFPGAENTHWSFPDPSSFTGSWEEKLAKTREVRDLIEDKIKDWIRTLK
jgi:arsenate reductase